MSACATEREREIRGERERELFPCRWFKSVALLSNLPPGADCIDSAAMSGWNSFRKEHARPWCNSFNQLLNYWARKKKINVQVILRAKPDKSWAKLARACRIPLGDGTAAGLFTALHSVLRLIVMKPSECHFRLHNKVTRKKLLFNKFIYNCQHDKLFSLDIVKCSSCFIIVLLFSVA